MSLKLIEGQDIQLFNLDNTSVVIVKNNNGMLSISVGPDENSATECLQLTEQGVLNLAGDLKTSGAISGVLKGYPLKEYNYDGTNIHKYWTKIGQFTSEKTGHLGVVVFAKHNINETHHTSAIVHFQKDNNGDIYSVSVISLGNVGGAEYEIKAQVDETGGLWVFNPVYFDSDQQFYVFRKYNVNIYTDASIYQEEQPASWVADPRNSIRISKQSDGFYAVSATYKPYYNFPDGVKIEGNTVWHAGNDGSGSGLDADTVDGKHASDFAPANHTHDDRYYTEAEVNNLLTNKANHRVAKLLIWYAYPSNINGTYDNQQASKIFSQYDLIVFPEDAEQPTHPDHYNVVEIVNYIKQYSPFTRIFGYIPTGNRAGIDKCYTVDEIYSKAQKWKDVGVHGIFLDEFGFDYGNDRTRQNDILDAVHSLGLIAFVNAWNPDDVFGGTPTIHWSNGIDWYLLESFGTVADGTNWYWVHSADVFYRAWQVKYQYSNFDIKVAGVATVNTDDQAETVYKIMYVISTVYGIDAFNVEKAYYYSSDVNLLNIPTLPDYAGNYKGNREPYAETTNWTLSSGTVLTGCERRYGKSAVGDYDFVWYDATPEPVYIFLSNFFVYDKEKGNLDLFTNVGKIIKAISGNSFTELDADTVDGKHAADLANVDLSNVDDNIVLTKATNVATLPPLLPHDSVLYFKDSLVDKVQELTPEGYDGSSITSYGLRTNGTTLVVTERTDDRIHPGVKSFAVEEGTTNLSIYEGFETFVVGTDIKNQVGYPSNNVVAQALITDEESYSGSKACKIICESNTNGQSYVGVGQTYSPASQNEYYTFHFKAKIVVGTWSDVWNESCMQMHSDTQYLGNFGSITVINLPNGWKHFIFSGQITNASTTRAVFHIRLGAKAGKRVEILVDEVQIEKKPFATSFTEGTRSTGNLIFPISCDINKIVVGGWFKADFIPTSTISGMSHNGILKLYNNTASLWVIDWYGTNGIFIRQHDSTTGNWRHYHIQYNASLDWWFLVLLVHDNTIELYHAAPSDNLDLRKFSTALESYMQNQTITALQIYPPYYNVASGLVSNLFVATYDPAVWTDAYIQYIYRTRSPFYI